MKKKSLIFLCFFLFLGILSCKDVSKINSEEASEVITNYLKINPEYKTTRFDFGELKFNSRNEMLELEKYRQLEEEGYITLTLLDSKKKFLSKDSSFVYLVKLTDKSREYVLKQDQQKATVKAVIYELTDEKPVDFNRINDNHAKVTVSLQKKNTVFAPFQKNSSDHSDFITKTYRLKLHKEEGWKVQ